MKGRDNICKQNPEMRLASIVTVISVGLLGQFYSDSNNAETKLKGLEVHSVQINNQI